MIKIGSSYASHGLFSYDKEGYFGTIWGNIILQKLEKQKQKTTCKCQIWGKLDDYKDHLQGEATCLR